jgi:hypothetical protein
MRHPYRLDYLFTYTAKMHGHHSFGPVPGGFRFNGYIREGTIDGPRLKGRFASHGGGDWFTLRTDGVGFLDVRATIETDDGALISMTEQGMDDFGPEGYARFLNNQSPPDPVTAWAQPRFATADPRYEWINRLFCLSIGRITRSRGEKIFDVYSVT